MSTKPTLGYWDNRTIVEPIRLLLALAGVEYDDVRYPVGPPPNYEKTEWNSAKTTLGLTCPNLPYWIEPSGLRLTQSHAILMHIAERTVLAGETPELRARVHMAVRTLSDWMEAFMRVTYCNSYVADPSTYEADVHVAGEQQARATSPKFERLRAAYLAESLPAHLANALKLLGEGEASSGWLVGAHAPTCADIVLFEYVDQHLIFEPSSLRADAALAPLLDHHARVLALPPIAAYRASSRFAAEPLHNVYSQFHRGWLPHANWARRPEALAAAAADVTLNVPATPMAAARTPVLAQPFGAEAAKRRARAWRDGGAFVALLVCLVLLVVIGRAAITFTPEQEAETSLEIGVAPAACAGEAGVPTCAGCCCE